MEIRRLRAARVLLATLLITLVLVPAAPRAHAVDEEQVRVALDQVTPTIAHPDDTVTVSGTVTNVTDVPLHHIQVLLWRDQAPITSTEQLDWVLGTAPSDPPGNPMVNPGNFVDLTRSVASPDLPPTLAPGESMPFEVTGTVEQMRLPQTNAVYPVGVIVKGNAQANFWPQTVGRGRTLLPVLADGERQDDVRGVLSSLVVLQSTPSQLGPGEFADDHLAEEVGPDGRLTALLSSAARSDVSWAVDPDLIASLEAMAAGYQVRGPTGLVAGSGAVNAARWLDDFKELDRARGHQIPYAQLDLAAISDREDADELVAAAVRAATRVTTTADLPVLGLPADGFADQATLDLLQALDPAIIVLSTASNPDAGIGQLDQTPVLTFAANAFAGGPVDSGAAGEPDTDLKVRQQMLASGLVAALRLEPSVRLITTATDAALDEAADADFMERRTITELASADPTRGFPAPTVPAGTPLLTERQLRRAEQVRTDHKLRAELLVNPGDTAERSDLATTRALSAAWRAKTTAHQTYVDLIRHDGGLLTGDAVTLGQPVPAILTGSTGSFPLSITNNLDVPVRVGVRVESANRSRLTVKSIDQIVIQPGERVQVQIAAEPAGNGEVAVVAQLVTVSGEPLGEPTTRTVIITQYGTVGWAIAISAGAAFFLFTALRIRKVRRQRGDEPELVAAAPRALPSGDGAAATAETRSTKARPTEVADD